LVALRRRSRGLNPARWALSEIDRLEAQCGAGEKGSGAFYAELTDIVRIYIERQFALAAPRLTTTEFLHRIESGEQIAPEHATLLRDFLSTADLIKFAGLELGQAEAIGATATARRFIQESAAADAVDGSAQEAA
jgi:hypothetical protein